MTPEQYKKCIEFDTNLKVGQLVNIRFTNSGNYYSFPAIITKLNENSIRAKATIHLEGYEPEREFFVYRFGAPQFTSNNGVFPNT